MIQYTIENLLEADVEAMVNAVNTVGVMGTMFVTEVTELIAPRWIINFPTKEHWRDPSQLAWIETGLKDLRRFLTGHGVRSVATPALGAGNGGLDWVWSAH